MSGVNYTSTLGVKAASPRALSKAMEILGGRHVRNTGNHNMRVYRFGSGRVLVPKNLRQGYEVGRSDLRHIISQALGIGIEPEELKRALDAAGCTWYGRPSTNGTRGDSMNEVLEREPEPAAEPEPETPKVWSGMGLKDAIRMGFGPGEDEKLATTIARTIGRLIAQRKGFVGSLVRGGEIVRYPPERGSNTHVYQLTETAATVIAEYAHQRWTQKHGYVSPPQPSTFTTDTLDPTKGTPPEPEPEPMPEPEPQPEIRTLNQALLALHVQFNVWPSLKDEPPHGLDVRDYLIRLAREVEHRVRGD